MGDPFNLERFVIAQLTVYERALRELRAGAKRTHWMWFIFPQLRGLGHSSAAQLYGITSLAEARAYLAHPELNARLIACVQALLRLNGRSLRAIFGTPDDLKFCSSMTLFAAAAPEFDSIFQEALARYCNGSADNMTTALLETSAR